MLFNATEFLPPQVLRGALFEQLQLKIEIEKDQNEYKKG